MMPDEYQANYAFRACERCHEHPATASLTFSYRGEEYVTRYYCPQCCDLAWDEAVTYVDAKAAALKEAGL